uniref:Uncharacterized protein n=1 Tax=Meloidogyne incognita TaxID=6306 RepID=A0A914NWU1_MELIC
MAANGPVLFLLSHEYRQAYAKQFPHILHSYMASYGDGGNAGVFASPYFKFKNSCSCPTTDK